MTLGEEAELDIDHCRVCGTAIVRGQECPRCSGQPLVRPTAPAPAAPAQPGRRQLSHGARWLIWMVVVFGALAVTMALGVTGYIMGAALFILPFAVIAIVIWLVTARR